MRCVGPADNLYQLNDGRFQLIWGGPVAPLMVGFEYILAERSLAQFLSKRHLNEVHFTPAIIFRRATNEEYLTHEQLTVPQLLNDWDGRDIPLSGEGLMLMGKSSLFATPALKLALEHSGFTYLRFSEGLDGFAAGT